MKVVSFNNFHLRQKLIVTPQDIQLCPLIRKLFVPHREHFKMIVCISLYIYQKCFTPQHWYEFWSPKLHHLVCSPISVTADPQNKANEKQRVVLKELQCVYFNVLRIISRLKALLCLYVCT